ncbi:Rha family transcriptional regulator [Xanthobacter sp. DSM 24535]|uniref:Rha family transcriptional regulator n=1 Tax=Roseixanthobacter psychrophilus TaxID=3119917 RepID=UPI00372C6BF9
MPVVFVRDGAVFANSRDIAGAFGKQHRNVLRDIDTLIIQAPPAALNFELSEYVDASGRRLRCFDMDRDGFTSWPWAS